MKESTQFYSMRDECRYLLISQLNLHWDAALINQCLFFYRLLRAMKNKFLK